MIRSSQKRQFAESVGMFLLGVTIGILPLSLGAALKTMGVRLHPYGMHPNTHGFAPGLFESNIRPKKKKRHPKDVSSFSGVDNGIRTHDLQSHNLTR